MFNNKLYKGRDVLENNQEIFIKKQKTTINFILFRMIVIFLLIISLTILKFVFNDTYQYIKTLYNDNIAVNITADYFKNAGDE